MIHDFPTANQLTEIYAGALGSFARAAAEKKIISEVLHISRPTLTEWIEIMEEYDFICHSPGGV